MTTKPINLEVNDSGAWRRVMTFDASNDDDSESVLHLADQLLRWGLNHRQRARLIIPADTAPLMTWSHEDGWRDWMRPGAAP